jgi:Flp pilus assembly protein TadD
MRSWKSFCLAVLSCAALAACQTDTYMTKPIDSMMGNHDAREARLSTAAAEAMRLGKTSEALAQYETLYRHSSRDKGTALNYAQLLRKTGSAARAAEVLAPYAERNDDPVIMNEYAADKIALGDFAEAEKILNAVLEDQKAVAVRHDTYDLMGIALDAEGRHKEAEQMFRLALDGWRGDATSVMNNLGLCLAAEGMFDDSLLTLRKALIMAPQKEEIARNIEIVSDLRSKVVKTAHAKPAKIKK